MSKTFTLRIEDPLEINNPKTAGIPKDIIDMVIRYVFHNGECNFNIVNTLMNKNGYQILPKMTVNIHGQTIIVYILKIDDTFIEEHRDQYACVSLNIYDIDDDSDDEYQYD